MPYPSDEPTRPLEYPLYNSADIEAPDEEVDDGVMLTWTETDPDVRVPVVMELSLNEYVALASAIDVGRDIAYNADSHKIWWIWIRSFQTMDFCAKVAECIENNEGVRAAIAALINGGTVPGEKMTSERRNADLASGTNPTCDWDILWSQSLAIVERMNDFFVFFTARIETMSNSTEIGTFLSSLPGVENLGVSALTGLANTLFAALPENYATAYSAADPETGFFWYEILACDIFCNAKPDCELTIEDVWQILQDRMEAALSGLASDWSNLLAWVNDFADLDITLLNMADFFYYLAFSGLRLGGLLIVTPATGDKVFQVAAALAADEPSNNWMTLCVDCGWSWTFPDTEGWTDFTLNLLSGAQTVIDGDKVAGANSTDGVAIFIDFEIEVDAEVSSLVISFEWSSDGTPLDQQMIIQVDGIEDTTQHITGTGVSTLALIGDYTGSHVYRFVGGVYGRTELGQYIRVTAQAWGGSGDNPFD